MVTAKRVSSQSYLTWALQFPQIWELHAGRTILFFFLYFHHLSAFFLSRRGPFYLLPHTLPLTPNKPIMLISAGVWEGGWAPPRRTRISWAHYPPATPFILVYSNASSTSAGLIAHCSCWFVFPFPQCAFCRPFIHLSVGLSVWIKVRTTRDHFLSLLEGRWDKTSPAVFVDVVVAAFVL
jgi:hypothetical protein